MKRINFIFSGITYLSLMLLFIPAFSQNPPASQTSGGINRQEKEIEKTRSLEERIKKERIKPEDVKIPIKKIIVKGELAISQKELKKIISAFEGKDLSLMEMQKIADLITAALQQRGFLDSLAYLPAQTIKDGLLIISVEKAAK